MDAETKLSSKGQVVIPKDIRDALDLHAGERLRVTREGRRVVLEAVTEPPARPKISYEEFRRRVPKYEGPPATLAEMDAAVDHMFAERDRR